MAIFVDSFTLENSEDISGSDHVFKFNIFDLINFTENDMLLPV